VHPQQICSRCEFQASLYGDDHVQDKDLMLECAHRRDGLAGSKMELPAHTRRARIEHGGGAMVRAVDGENRLQVLRHLQDEARVVFASSGETVDRFLCERRDEARRGSGPPA
jgi:hypothetical protein